MVNFDIVETLDVYSSIIFNVRFVGWILSLFSKFWKQAHIRRQTNFRVDNFGVENHDIFFWLLIVNGIKCTRIRIQCPIY